MKKLILGLGALAFIFTTAPVMAAGVRVPRNLCISWPGLPAISILALKSAGNARTASGNVRFYDIRGHESAQGLQHPVHGNGYVAPGSTILHAVMHGAVVGGAAPFRWTETLELFFDLVTNTGTIIFHLENLAGTKVTGESAVTAVDCTALPMTAIGVGEAGPAGSLSGN